MTVSEKTPLLPQEYQKSYIIPIQAPEDFNNNPDPSLTEQYDSYALTKEELNKFINDPCWIRIRYVCMSIYWVVCLSALFISCFMAFTALENGFCDAAMNKSSSSSVAADNGTDVLATTILPFDLKTTTAATISTDTTKQPTDGTTRVIFGVLEHPA
ncbi:uncharacterized protein LOC129748810 [Uranotaenia lowii]|uniref:uncharacterized protein LOC129748810 n=1 Tax=Uranotaenia lowii TaxID=190385 RepID=UPI002478AD1C|nr:uncharacterized protein LOC129748810 [Uranotaenia lowii]